MMIAETGSATAAPSKSSPPSAAPLNRFSAEAAARRRVAVVRLMRTLAQANKPAPTNAELAVLYGVALTTITEDMRVLRQRRLLATTVRKWSAENKNGRGSRYKVERQVTVCATGETTAWPTEGPPVKVRSNKVPPCYWGTSRMQRPVASTAPDPVERAKDIVRRKTGKVVFHARTREPTAPADLILVDHRQMTEAELIAWAGRLVAQGAPA